MSPLIRTSQISDVGVSVLLGKLVLVRQRRFVLTAVHTVPAADRRPSRKHRRQRRWTSNRPLVHVGLSDSLVVTLQRCINLNVSQKLIITYSTPHHLHLHTNN